MKMKKQSGRILLAASIALIAWSCNQSDPAPKGDYITGVFVINEGNFQTNNGSISFVKREESTAQSDIFNLVNKAVLQGGVQGYAVAGESGLILVDNDKAGQDKLQIVNSNTFETIASIGSPDIENPREVVVASNTIAYVTCWGTTGIYPNFFVNPGYVAVVDLTTNKVTKKISLVKGVENIAFSNGKLFVGTVDYSGVNTLSVISTATNEVVKSITFTNAPNPIGFDANGKVWVQNGLEVSRINPDTYVSEATLKLGSDVTKSAGNFAFSADRKSIFFSLSYYVGSVTKGETYKFAITDAQVNVTTPVIKRVFSGLAVDPSQGLIYAAVTPSYGQAGYAVRYRSDGSLVDSVKVGIAPTGFFFR